MLIQNKTFIKEIIVLDDKERCLLNEPEQLVDIILEQPERDRVQKKQIIPEIINKEDNDSEIPDIFFEDTDPDEPVDINKIVEVVLEDGIKEEDEVDFVFLEEIPLFPGCKGTNKERKAGFVKK